MAIIVHLCCCFLILLRAGAMAATVPALYVLGDSLADVGNNNFSPLSFLKANYPHNGVDYPGGKATGRFSNGKNSADFMAELLGGPSPPPYLSIHRGNSNKTQLFLQGVNFASGGAGVLDTTNSAQCLTFSKQIKYFSKVCTDLVQQLGRDQANNHMAKSIFTLIIGSNDIFMYINSPKITPQEFVDSMITKLGEQLKTLYSLGARKFAFVGTGPVGCCPWRRNESTGSCNDKANTVSLMFNAGVAPLLQKMKSEHGDMSYSFFNSSFAFSAILQNPATYGFTEVKEPCCGFGNISAKLACLPISSLCSNRSNHAFWDFVHPSQRTAQLLTTIFFHGSSPNVYPINVKMLSSL